MVYDLLRVSVRRHMVLAMTDEVLLAQLDYRARQAVGRAARDQRLPRTQEQIEELSGFPQSVLSRIENGQQRLTLGLIIKLALSLDCRPSDLLGPIDDALGLERTA